jgi:hypothetical protein
MPSEALAEDDAQGHRPRMTMVIPSSTAEIAGDPQRFVEEMRRGRIINLTDLGYVIAPTAEIVASPMNWRKRNCDGSSISALRGRRVRLGRHDPGLTHCFSHARSGAYRLASIVQLVMQVTLLESDKS